ncbi:MAG: peptide deformylase [Bdellovibrionales bacterium]|jgi:peptide deformylase|nr:peptide deformylase [Bdellovibrionales bacterium]
MAVLPIYVAPHPVLKKPAEPVAAVTDDIRQLVKDMFDTMYDARGIGLAAPQIGQSVRVLVMDVEQTGAPEDDEGEEESLQPLTPGKPIAVINPEIVWTSDDMNTYEEGCLSIPGQYAPVDRPEKVRIKYLDENGAAQEMEADGLLATCIQHEIDHLDGILFTDHLSSLKRDMVMRKLKKWTRDHAEDIKESHVLP